MDRKELINKFSEETGEKVFANLPDMGSYDNKYVHWLEQMVVKNCSIHYVSQQRGLLESFRDWLNNTKTSDSNINNGDLDDFLEDYNGA
jgi:hypothetical protein